jgi:hypothetical protein
MRLNSQQALEMPRLQRIPNLGASGKRVPWALGLGNLSLQCDLKESKQ